MPNDNNDDDLTNLSIDEINELYSDIIEFPEDIRIAACYNNTPARAYVCDDGK